MHRLGTKKNGIKIAISEEAYCKTKLRDGKTLGGSLMQGKPYSEETTIYVLCLVC